jgi:tetratricopeptide (TPR) repeat protein
MAEVILDSVTTERAVRQVSALLNSFYEAEKNRNDGFEATYWRGQLAGFRRALEFIVGPKATVEIIEIARGEIRKTLGEPLADALIERAFPQSDHNLANWGYVYQVLGFHDKALDENLKALDQNPTSAARYGFLVGCNILLNRLSEAQTLIEEAESKSLDSPGLHFGSYCLAFLNRDVIGMEKQVAWAMERPAAEHFILSLEARTSAFYGHLKAARGLTQRAVRSAVSLEDQELAGAYQTDAALREAVFGNAIEARQEAEHALTLSSVRDTKYEAALAKALAGDGACALSLRDEFTLNSSEDNLVQFNYLPTLDAAVALCRNDPFKAIEVLHAASPYELGDVGNTALYPIHIRGEAFLATLQGQQAADEFQKILDHPGIVLNEPIGALAHLGIARAYLLQGESAKAKAAYQDFLTLWKDADLDVPILIAAKAEYAKLK